MTKPNDCDITTWLNEHDLASKLEGWLITNDSEDLYCLARLDDPLSLEGTPGWPKDFVEPKFDSDEEAIEFVRHRGRAGSAWHAEALAIHEAKIPVYSRFCDAQGSSVSPSYATRILEEILDHCSAGPWRHGLHVLPFSADSQPCVFGNERELPLALLDEDDAEAASNVVLLAAAWELCRQLGLLLDAATPTAQAADDHAEKLQLQCRKVADILVRIHRDILHTTAERYGKECDEDD